MSPPCSFGSFAPSSLSGSESQPGSEHQGVMNSGVMEPREHLVVVSWMRSRARALAPGVAVSIAQPGRCQQCSSGIGAAVCHL